jgi:hypothetical protein
LNKFIKRTIVFLGVYLLLVGTQVIAAPIFSDNFESGLGQWPTNSSGSGQTVLDPLLLTNHVLNFKGLGSGGTLFTAKNLAGGAYHLAFDILGTCTSGNCGGFAGIDDGTGEHWLVGDANYSAVLLTLMNTGAWQHVDVQFTATGSFDIKLEDFVSSPPAGDVYFDNICVATTANVGACPTRGASVPEPTTLALLGLGLAGLGFSRRKQV